MNRELIVCLDENSFCRPIERIQQFHGVELVVLMEHLPK
jgi:hypothetical protein